MLSLSQKDDFVPVYVGSIIIYNFISTENPQPKKTILTEMFQLYRFTKQAYLNYEIRVEWVQLHVDEERSSRPLNMMWYLSNSTEPSLTSYLFLS